MTEAGMRFEADLVEERIGYRFLNRDLLIEAFTHASAINEMGAIQKRDNERLELLGDRVLNLIAADYVYTCFFEESEGVLSQMIARLVEASSCLHYVTVLGVKEFLLMGKGERMQVVSDVKYSDLFEAILGAIYLDAGFEAAKMFFREKLGAVIEELLKEPLIDVKGILQSLCQKYLAEVPEYIVKREEGPDHEKIFHIEVIIKEISMGLGRGRSKKEAQIEAAREALQKCRERGYFEN